MSTREHLEDPRYRARLLDILAAEMPLSYTAGRKALASWAGELPNGPISLISATGRGIFFYLGPARRLFGSPDATLTHGRGRAAIVVSRAAVKPTWKFAPFDMGEILYNWQHTHIAPQFANLQVTEHLDQWLQDIDSLTGSFRSFLAEAYEHPLDYLRSWAHPRPAIPFGHERNEIYRAATQRWFGRVRGFSPAWTYEIKADPPVVQIDANHLIALVLIDDEITNSAVSIDTLREILGDRLHLYPVAGELKHPDLGPIILDAATSHIIRNFLVARLDLELSQ